MKPLRIFFGMATMLLVAALWGAGVPAAAPLSSQRLANGHPIPPHIVTILDRTCPDCHSNQTRWPWYNRVPGVAQLIQRDVRKAREKVDFSTWTSARHVTANEIQDLCDAVSDGAMPPLSYRLTHSQARLSEPDKDAICGWALQIQRPGE
jgi:heme-binding protein